jgi:predicted dehydrogenase
VGTDTFVIVLEYADKPTICTVKTTVVNVLRDPLKYVIRGSDGSFIKFGECHQEAHTANGTSTEDPEFGKDEERLWGQLTTRECFDEDHQTYDEASKKWIGAYPTVTGYWRGLYENVVAAIRGEAELEVKPEQSRDGIRVMELARQSWMEGRKVPWS